MKHAWSDFAETENSVTYCLCVNDDANILITAYHAILHRLAVYCQRLDNLECILIGNNDSYEGSMN